MHTIAIVGAGRMAEAHAGAWARAGLGGSIRYIVSPRTQPNLVAAPSAQWVTDLDTVLADPEVTIVSICTPTPTHAPLAIRALEAGRNVLLEKPIALTIADARAIEVAAERSAGTLMVAHVVRFFDEYAGLAHRVEQGSVGAPRLVRATRLTAGADQPSWMADESQSGGLLVDFAIHDFDQANAYLGDPLWVRSTRAGAGPGAAVSTVVEYVNGGLAQVVSAADLPVTFEFETSLGVLGTSGTDAAAAHTGDPFLAQAEYFLYCLTVGSEPVRASASAAIDALRVALAARESLATGERTPVR